MRMRMTFVAGLALLAGVGSASGGRAEVWYVAGTWQGGDRSIYEISQARGSTHVEWDARAADGKLWAHHFAGEIRGDYIVGHYKDSTSTAYQIHSEGDLVLRVVDGEHLEWAPSYGSVRSAPILTRSWFKVDEPTERDTAAPAVTALRSKGVRGNTARLAYRVRDDSGETSELVWVRNEDGRTIWRVRTKLGKADGRVFYVRFKIPARLHAADFCVQATDRAGNRSRVSCALLVVY